MIKDFLFRHRYRQRKKLSTWRPYADGRKQKRRGERGRRGPRRWECHAMFFENFLGMLPARSYSGRVWCNFRWILQSANSAFALTRRAATAATVSKVLDEKDRAAVGWQGRLEEPVEEAFIRRRRCLLMQSLSERVRLLLQSAIHSTSASHIHYLSFYTFCRQRAFIYQPNTRRKSQRTY